MPSNTSERPVQRTLWQRLTRLMRHRWMDERSARRALPPDMLQRISTRVTASERRHTGEVRILAEASLPTSYLLRDAAPRERALALFGKLRVWDTEHNKSVLIYLQLTDHAIEIVADRGLSRMVSPEAWQAMVRRLGEALRDNRYEDGLTQALEEVSALLVAHFPLSEGEVRRNELPDAVALQ